MPVWVVVTSGWGCSPQIRCQAIDFSVSKSVSSHLRTPPNRHLTPRNPQSAPLAQVLALGNQTHRHAREEQGGGDGKVLPPASSTLRRVELLHRSSFQLKSRADRERARDPVTKIPGVFDSARDSVPVAHDDSTTLLGICTHEAGRCLKVFKRTRPLPPIPPQDTTPAERPTERTDWSDAWLRVKTSRSDQTALRRNYFANADLVRSRATASGDLPKALCMGSSKRKSK